MNKAFEGSLCVLHSVRYPLTLPATPHRFKARVGFWLEQHPLAVKDSIRINEWEGGFSTQAYCVYGESNITSRCGLRCVDTRGYRCVEWAEKKEMRE
jgi:hypothetical protein